MLDKFYHLFWCEKLRAMRIKISNQIRKKPKKLSTIYKIFLFLISGEKVSADYYIGNLYAIFLQPQLYCIQWADVSRYYNVKPVDCYIFPHDKKEREPKNGIKKQKRITLRYVYTNACAINFRILPKLKLCFFFYLELDLVICGEVWERNLTFRLKGGNWFFHILI